MSETETERDGGEEVECVLREAALVVINNLAMLAW